MDSEQNKSSTPSLCAGSCGFYGNPATRNMCSKCYRDHLKKEQDQARKETSGAGASVDVKNLPTAAPTPVSSPPAHVQSGPAPMDVSMTPRGETASTAATVAPSSSTSMAPPVMTEAIALPDAHRDVVMMDTVDSTSCSMAASPLPEVNVVPSSSSAGACASSTPKTPLHITPAVEAPKVAMASPAAAKSAAANPEKKQQNPGRCLSCNKKVGLLGFQCRCGYVFCGQHRYADAHSCDFDYKTFERDQLRLKNPDCTASKVDKI